LSNNTLIEWKQDLPPTSHSFTQLSLTSK
jgi:hypothetical protein